jgi:hypothetical protein
MHLPKQSMRPAILIAITTLATACTVQLVAPYNSELQQKAAAMQAKVVAWVKARLAQDLAGAILR